VDGTVQARLRSSEYVRHGRYDGQTVEYQISPTVSSSKTGNHSTRKTTRRGDRFMLIKKYRFLKFITVSDAETTVKTANIQVEGQMV
jgi:hypothetical protein